MIYLSPNCREPLYKQLYDALKAEILNGSLEYNSRVVPIRKLSQELNISRNTVDHAYQQLVSEGLLRTVRGSGYFVDYQADNIPSGGVNEQNRERKKAVRLKYDFCYTAMDSATFPWSRWKRCVQNALLDEECQKQLDYECNKGYQPLRQALCEYLRNMRGVACQSNNVCICAGTQYGLQTILSLLPRRKYRVAFENPGFDGMKRIFENVGMEIVPIDVLDDGIDLEQVREQRCNLLYITPSHQFPTGVITSMKKRLEMLEWAQEHDVYIIENDYDNEFSFGQSRLPSLHSMDTSGHVIYISMLTKVLGPSVRCAYYVLPDSMLDVYNNQFGFFNAALPTYHQAALAEFIREGYLERHIREMAMLNKRKYEMIREIFDREGNQQVQMSSHVAGAHMLITIPDCTDQKKLVEFMAEHAIGLYATADYYSEPEKAQPNVFLFGFNSMDERKLEVGCRSFLAVLREYLNRK
ncbi:MAG: PLP-dependent aminotransferase family protein [Butyricicoccus sp.]